MMIMISKFNGKSTPKRSSPGNLDSAVLIPSAFIAGQHIKKNSHKYYERDIALKG